MCVAFLFGLARPHSYFFFTTSLVSFARPLALQDVIGCFALAEHGRSDVIKIAMVALLQPWAP